MQPITDTSIPGWCLCCYIPKTGGNTPDDFSDYLLKFKNNSSPFVELWCKWADKESKGAFRGQINHIVRALASEETIASGTKSLDVLGRYLQNSIGATYRPEALKKSRPTKSLKYLKLPERFAEVNKVYYIERNYNKIKNGDSILIIDDVSTSNTTLNEIIRCIRVKFPNSPLRFFSLAKTKHDGGINNTLNIADYFFINREEILGGSCSSLHYYEFNGQEKTIRIDFPKNSKFEEKKHENGFIYYDTQVFIDGQEHWITDADIRVLGSFVGVNMQIHLKKTTTNYSEIEVLSFGDIHTRFTWKYSNR